MTKPCQNCPWRLDAPVGEFELDRYRSLARCADDLSSVIFQCHKSGEGDDVACAGFLQAGATHNMAVRFAYLSRRLEPMDRSGGAPLHPNFNAMAIRQGLDADDPALWGCRTDQ